MTKFNCICLTIVIILNSPYLNAENLGIADKHAPISVHGDHMHKKNGFMFSYRKSNMLMSQVKSGKTNMEIDEIMSAPNYASDGSGTYMNAPIEMRMDMHMFGTMYAPNDSLTVSLMTNYSRKEMTQQRMAMSGSARFDVKSSGFGDTKFTGLIKIINNPEIKSHLGLGLSAPTGNINQRDSTPASSDARLGYGMQNGSGTFDPFVFSNNVIDYDKVKVGGQIYFKMPSSGKNAKGYQYGDTFITTFWTSYRWADYLSTSFKIDYNLKKKMKGSDNEMNPRMSPAMDSKNQGYQKSTIGFGINFVNRNDFFKNHRIGIELILPIYQKYRGIQISEDFKTIFGWQYGF